MEWVELIAGLLHHFCQTWWKNPTTGPTISSQDAQTEARVCSLLSFYKLRWQPSPHQVAQCFAIFGPNSPASHLSDDGKLQQGCRLFRIGLDHSDHQL